jgi:signal transduction histidine kinase
VSEGSEKFKRQLVSNIPRERLAAARFFSSHAAANDLEHLQSALANESVNWIEGALKRAILRANPEASFRLTRAPEQRSESDSPEGYSTQVYAEALEVTSKQILHELEPLVGSARLAASREIENFNESKTNAILSQLNDFMAAISRLREAASPPRTEEFHLDLTIDDLIEQAECGDDVDFLVSGTRPCTVVGDRGLVTLAFKNGLKNAIEARKSKSEGVSSKIVVTWGVTDVDYWVSILDNGVGFTGNVVRAFEMGRTSKTNHLGMGLAIAKQSMLSMNGEVSLVPDDKGMLYHMNWPKKAR